MGGDKTASLWGDSGNRRGGWVAGHLADPWREATTALEHNDPDPTADHIGRKFLMVGHSCAHSAVSRKLRLDFGHCGDGPLVNEVEAGRYWIESRWRLGGKETSRNSLAPLNSHSSARVWLPFALVCGAPVGATAAGTVRVRCVETEEVWEVALVDGLDRAAGVRAHPLASPILPNGRRTDERSRADGATALRQLAAQLEANEERLS